MNHEKLFKGLFLALLTGTVLIYTLGAAAIASASISGHEALIPGMISAMVSAGMTWLFLTGIPCLALYCYGIYTDLFTFMTSVADNMSAAFSAIGKKKSAPNIEQIDRLALNDHEELLRHLSTPDSIQQLKETK